MFTLPYSGWSSSPYSDRFYDFPTTICRCYKDVYVNSFFPRTAILWNSLPIKCFPLNRFYLLQSFWASFSCNSMPSSDCSALHGVNTIFFQKHRMLSQPRTTFITHYKLKLMLNYLGFVIWNIFVISELFWKKISTRLASTIFGNF